MSDCTGWLDGWWADCCRLHDLAYDAQIGRLLADHELAACVAASLPAWAVDSPSLAALAAATACAMARVMFIGVRVFGAAFYRRAGRG